MRWGCFLIVAALCCSGCQMPRADWDSSPEVQSALDAYRNKRTAEIERFGLANSSVETVARLIQNRLEPDRLQLYEVMRKNGASEWTIYGFDQASEEALCNEILEYRAFQAAKVGASQGLPDKAGLQRWRTNTGAPSLASERAYREWMMRLGGATAERQHSGIQSPDELTRLVLQDASPLEQKVSHEMTVDGFDQSTINWFITDTKTWLSSEVQRATRPGGTSN